MIYIPARAGLGPLPMLGGVRRSTPAIAGNGLIPARAGRGRWRYIDIIVSNAEHLWGPWWHGSGLGLAAVDATDLIVLLVESAGLLALNATCFGYVRLRGSLGWSSSSETGEA